MELPERHELNSLVHLNQIFFVKFEKLPQLQTRAVTTKLLWPNKFVIRKENNAISQLSLCILALFFGK